MFQEKITLWSLVLLLAIVSLLVGSNGSSLTGAATNEPLAKTTNLAKIIPEGDLSCIKFKENTPIGKIQASTKEECERKKGRWVILKPKTPVAESTAPKSTTPINITKKEVNYAPLKIPDQRCEAGTIKLKSSELKFAGKTSWLEIFTGFYKYNCEIKYYCTSKKTKKLSLGQTTNGIRTTFFKDFGLTYTKSLEDCKRNGVI